jgi:predicted  nucleic acid-binding Zn-ribbon protein
MFGKQKPTGKDGPVATMICVTCGAEQFFDRAVPGAITCAKCGGTVFREFDTPAADDEAAASAAEEQARSMAYGDSSPGMSPDEVIDLDQGPR